MGKFSHSLLLWINIGIIFMVLNPELGNASGSVCNETQFQCTTIYQCIRQTFKCDGDDDCIDGSDEVGCDVEQCVEDQIKCGYGICLPKSFECDGDPDCPDGSDESPVRCQANQTLIADSESSNASSSTVTPESAESSSSTPSLCDEDQFQCNARTGGNCIAKAYLCDDDNDCIDGSDELNCSVCVKQVNRSALPDCKVVFYKGTVRDLDSWSCVNGYNSNVFRVKASRSHVPDTRDPFVDPKVTYMRLSCVAPYGIDFYFEGVGALETFGVTKGQKVEPQGYSDTNVGNLINVVSVVSPSGTGKYIVRSPDDPTKGVSIFMFVEIDNVLFHEDDRKPYMLGRGRTLKATRRTGTPDNIILPCISTNVNVSVFLFKEAGENWTKIDTIPYDPMQGFVFNISSELAGKYRCTTDESNKSDLDLLTINVDPSLVSDVELPQQEPNIKIVFDNKYGLGATCHAINNSTLNSTVSQFPTFTNLHANNPAEARLSIACFTKGYKFCGSRPHITHNDPGFSEPKTPCAKGVGGTQCVHISHLYPQGALVCKLGQDVVVQQYFTGLDDKIYTSWEAAPAEALLKLEAPLNSNGSFETATSYHFKCPSAGLVFAKNPVVLSALYANGIEEKLSNTLSTGQMVVFTFGMVKLTCTDYLWSTGAARTSSMNISVTVKPCSVLQFTCDNGQCIRASWHCDRGTDCSDGSDERGCFPEASTAAPIVGCLSSQFRCNNGICKPASYKCDGDRDCSDGSDELDCRTTTTTTTTTTTSTTTVKPIIPCPNNQFTCRNGDCIDDTHKCDGEADCSDQSDESPIIECPAVTTIPTTTERTVPPGPTSAHAPPNPNREDENSENEEHHEGNEEPDAEHSDAFLVAGLITISVLIVLLLLMAIGIKFYKLRAGGSRMPIRFRQHEDEVLMED